MADEIGKAAKRASHILSTLSVEVRNDILSAVKAALIKDKQQILQANQEDVATCDDANGPLLQRLKLTDGKFDTLIQGIDQVISLPDPLGKISLKTEVCEGLVLERIACPIGVLAVIYEARPEAGVQIASLAIKSGNALILKGGKEAVRSNAAIYKAFRHGLAAVQNDHPSIPLDALQLMETREDIKQLVQSTKYVDLVIPRGSNALVRHIQEITRIPVLGHADGLCCMYVDEHIPDLTEALEIIVDSKTNYVAACNSLETLLIHEKAISNVLPRLADAFSKIAVEFHADERCREYLPEKQTRVASEADWRTEFLDFKLAIKCVRNVEEAIEHVNEYSSHHTDSIISAIPENIKRFQAAVDSACVFANCSTRFSDGFRFGFGAEVGISTSKIHARGPVGLNGLVIYKYKLSGKGHCVGKVGGQYDYIHKELNY